jgi:DNA-binding MarR family transcriptional regulator
MASTPSIPPVAMPFVAGASASPHMTCRQMVILATAVANPGMSTGAFARMLDLEKPVITRATYSLQDMSLLRIATDPTDRRRVMITASSKGAALIASVGGVS